MQKAIVIPVEGDPQIVDFDGELDTLQKLVGGWIEPLDNGSAFGSLTAYELKIDLFAGAPSNSCVMTLVNEEGFLRELPVNRTLTQAFGQLIVGPAVIVALD